MLFGRYKGVPPVDLSEPCILWLSRQVFPKGKLGSMLQTLYEIKVSGLEYLFEPYRQDRAQ